MELNLGLARIAIKLEQFQKFMQEKIKITDAELAELMACGGTKCWGNFEWLDRTVSTINEELARLELEGKLVVRTPKPAIHKIFEPDEMEAALNFIKEAPEGYAFQIILRDKN